MAHRRFVSLLLAGAVAASASAVAAAQAAAQPTATPIKHLVVIFQENVSFDHYFGTYPNAANPPGEPSFKAAPGTPTVNGLSGALLTDNPNVTATGKQVNPQRLDRSAGVHVRPGPRLHGRATGVRPRPDG